MKQKLEIFGDKYLSPATNRALKYCCRLNVIIVFEYIIFIGIIIFVLSDIIPVLIKELSELPETMPFLSEEIKAITGKLNEIRNINTELEGTLERATTSQDLNAIYQIVDNLKSFSLVFLQIILSLILSFVFLIDRDKLQNYLKGIKSSHFGFLYKEYKEIFSKVVTSFGLVLKAQGTIAIVNAFLTILGLLCIGAIHGTTFPYLLTLGLIVFIFGFVPILGFIISSIPILIVAFATIGGYQIIIEIILLITLIHLLEAYYLNPRIVSSYLKLPVSLTFIILMVSEHFFGIAGLIVGVSMYYFVSGLFKDFDKMVKRNKRKSVK